MKKFEEYSEEHVNFHEPKIVPRLVKNAINITKLKKKSIMLGDLGCGDANILNQLLNIGMLTKDEMVGIEPSDIRRDRSKCSFKIVRGFAEKVPFNKNHFDVIISNQVIEHIKDEKPMLMEVKRILKKDGLFYVSSVIKKPWGFWIYWKDGGFVSDPTHYKEYKSKKEFENLIINNGFEIVDTHMELFKHPFIDLFVRFLIKLKMVKPEKVVKLYEKHHFIFFIRNLFKWPMFGFYNVEILARKIN